MTSYEDVTDMASMFAGCRSLPALDVSGFNTSNVEDKSEMFSDCSALTTLTLGEGFTAVTEEMALGNRPAWVNSKAPRTVVSGNGDYAVFTNEGLNTYVRLGDAPEIPYTLGDVNEDGVVNANDAARILMAAARIGAKRDSGLTEAQALAANVNGDSAINANDASIVLRYSAAIGAKRQVELTDFI